jgi:hypothetical protein
MEREYGDLVIMYNNMTTAFSFPLSTFPSPAAYFVVYYERVFSVGQYSVPAIQSVIKLLLMCLSH